VRPPRWRARRGHRPLVTVALLVSVNGLVISGSVLAGHWHLPQLAGNVSSVRRLAVRARSLSLSAHYAGVAVTRPIAPSLATFRHILGKPPGLVEYYMAFGKHCPSARVSALARDGTLSLIQINPRHISLARIAAGKYDSYLRGYAAAVRALGTPVGISFGHEMNGWWYPWGLPRTPPATFVAAWRHMHDVFARAGASHVVWVWTVSRDATRRSWPAASAWWPGPAYVSWIAIDGYFRKPRQSFDYVFGKQLAEIRSFTNKPVLIGETAAAPGPRQGTQIQSLVSGVTSHHLLGFVWFNIDAKARWDINHDAAAVAALRQALASAPRAARTPRAAPAASQRHS
jgi:mannan endo-1,4-beta-mannosidase